MEALRKFNELSSTIHEQKSQLSSEQEKLLRQRTFFVDALERAEIIDDKESIEKAGKGIMIIEQKLQVVETDINVLNLEPLAEAVLSEAKEKLNELKQAVEAQWEKVIEARIDFLSELKELGELRRQFQGICWATHGAAKILRKNPLPVPGISGQHQLVVGLDQINDLIKA